MDSEVSSICSANNPFCLGMCEWMNCSGVPKEPHLPTLSPHPEITPTTSSSAYPEPLLPSKRQPDCFHFKSDEELLQLAKGYMPANTNRSTKWALKAFDLWSQARNQCYPEDPILEHLLTSCDPVFLNTHLAKFVVEARKANGDCYLLARVHHLLQ